MSTDEVQDALLCPEDSPQTVLSDPEGISALPLQGPKASLDKNSVTQSKSGSVKFSSSSFRPASVTSTIAHQQTPFVEFEIQVRRLCHSSWPPTVKGHRADRLLEIPNSRLLGRLRAKTFVRFLRQTSPPKEFDSETSLPREFDIERMSGGTYNPVGKRRSPLILCGEHHGWGGNSRPDREVATLNYIRQEAYHFVLV